MQESYILNNINDMYRDHIMYIWAPSIFQHANYIIGILALIQVIWTISFLTIKGHEFDSIVVTALKQLQNSLPVKVDLPTEVYSA
ncbi:MAG TPA: hypothetical protein DD381_13900 [Lentisphaeria bacterium]|nr:MAG: hypothetical protein A2X47_02475 [Lentisphaerae bacterium GWF2_38_69]HBM17416.1 hypothetical protein [Lentisphaeria bacterium]